MTEFSPAARLRAIEVSAELAGLMVQRSLPTSTATAREHPQTCQHALRAIRHLDSHLDTRSEIMLRVLSSGKLEFGEFRSAAWLAIGETVILRHPPSTISRCLNID